MKKEITFCDICTKETPIKRETYQTIFTTEQTEGRSTEHYLTLSTIDVCSECKNKILQGHAVWAHGAQGHNTYYFKGKK